MIKSFCLSNVGMQSRFDLRLGEERDILYIACLFTLCTFFHHPVGLFSLPFCPYFRFVSVDCVSVDCKYPTHENGKITKERDIEMKNMYHRSVLVS